MTWLSDHWLSLTWTLLALAFLAAVVRKSRARSQRLFVDRPNAVLASLQHDTTHLHEMDSA